MNLCVKKTYLYREIDLIYLTNNQNIIVYFKDTDISESENIELTSMELDQINKIYVNRPMQSDQVKPDGP